MSKSETPFFLQKARSLVGRIVAISASAAHRSCVAAILLAAFSSMGGHVNADEPERWAIVVGIDKYFDLNPLTSSSQDATQFSEVLTERCGFKNVSLVVDQPKKPDSRAMLQVRYKPLKERLRNFIKAAEQSGVQTLVVYYSGHGCAVLNPGLQQPADLLLPAIDASESDGQLTNALSKNEIQTLLAQADIPEKLLVLDCCHAARPDQIPMAGKAVLIGPSQGTNLTPTPSSGSLIAPSSSGVTSNSYDAAKTQPDSSFVVLAGSGFQQVAGEQVFTKYIIEGLSVIGDSAKDADKSLWIETDELFRHVRKSMSAKGGQTPHMELVSGTLDGIAIAPSIFQPDPQRSMSVYVESSKGNVVSQATVRLVFFDEALSQPETLASGVTNQKGKANLDYHFGATRDREGMFQIDVTPQTEQYQSKVTGLSDFTNTPSGAVFKIALRNRQPDYSKGTRPKFPTPNAGNSVLESRGKAVAEPTHQEVLNSISAYIKKNKKVPDICSFEKYFSEYYALMKGLKRTDKLRVSGVAICFPSVAYWKQNDKFRAQVLKVLTTKGVVNPTLIASRRTKSFSNGREPSYNEVKKAAFGFVERIDADVCGLGDYVDGYKALMDTLDKSEKYEALPGLPICFPSKAFWLKKPSFRKEFVKVLRDSFVLTK